MEDYQLRLLDRHSVITFNAMTSPCELLVDCLDSQLLHKLATYAVTETRRIEQKYSRYIRGNLCDRINNSQAKPVTIDEECYRLLSFADECYQLSDGLFDITSGVLRKVWQFDGSDNIATQSDISAILPFIGWKKVEYSPSSIILPNLMQIDFGGIGKEYAVSRVAQGCLTLAPEHSVLVNFGGDIQINQIRKDQRAWQVGIENPLADNCAMQYLAIKQGAVATSGDSKRYLLKEGLRYSHILNPKTGWPVTNAPKSVTVATSQCIQAGCLATLALLQGEDAEAFLAAQQVQFWCKR